MIPVLPFLLVLLGAGAASLAAFFWSPYWLIVAAPLGLLALVGIGDKLQRKHSLLRNFPLAAHLRWFFEWLRPYLRGYIVESDVEGQPFNIEDRALVYRRAKDVSSVEPFGSQLDFQRPTYEWLTHSVVARKVAEENFRTTVGGPDCARPYSASVFNISAMSFGALGAHAIEALNRGAAKGNFFHDTGEGGVSRYHRAGGGDLCGSSAPDITVVAPSLDVLIRSFSPIKHRSTR